MTEDQNNANGQTATNEAVANQHKFNLDHKPIDSKTTASVSDASKLYTDNESYTIYKAEFKLPVDKRSAGFKFYPNLAIPSTTRSGYDSSVSQFQNRRVGDSDEMWLDTYLSSAARLPQDRFYEKVLSNKNSQWVDSVEHSGVHMTQNSSKRTAPGELRGSAAVDAVLRKHNKPGTSRMPLWHSGFWVYYRPMNGQDISDLLNLIASSKALVGNMTYGRAFATDTSYIDKAVLEFFFERLVTTSSISTQESNFDYTKYVLLPDKNVIYGYLMSKCFPSGFSYNRPCINPGCGAVHDGLLDLNYIVRVDQSKLSEKQKQHMLNMNDGSTSIEAIEAYQSEFDWVSREFENNGVTFKVKIPNLKTYMDSCNSYLDNIHSMYTEALFQQPNERALAMRRAMDATTCVQYAHYITEIEITNTTDEGIVKSYIKETATISQVLEALSTESNDVKSFVRNINKAAADSTIALCAITSYKCDSCGSWQNQGDNDKDQILIPIDPLSTFFTLASQVTEEQSRAAKAI